MTTVPWKRTVIVLLVFGTAFGYLEAAVADYLGQLYEPARQRFYPDRPSSEQFPLLTLDQLQALGSDQQRTVAVEIGRETATIVMLAAVALRTGRPCVHHATKNIPKSICFWSTAEGSKNNMEDRVQEYGKMIQC